MNEESGFTPYPSSSRALAKRGSQACGTRSPAALSATEDDEVRASSAAAAHQEGFTLIELSIVLVIIGLIVGGVTVGLDLIEAAKERQLGSQMEEYKLAVNTFRLKYDCLPGDCKNATTFFGSAGGTGSVTDTNCTTPASTNKGSTGTCNGTNNRKISLSANIGDGAEGYERFLFWQHLALAGMIEGQYATIGSGISYGHEPNYNVPQLDYYNAVVGIYRSDDAAAIAVSNIYRFSPTLIGKHSLIVGLTNQPVGTWWNGPQPFTDGLTSHRLDTKFDDGKPFTGKVTASYHDYTGQGCVTPHSNVSTSEYATTGLWATQNIGHIANCMMVFELF